MEESIRNALANSFDDEGNFVEVNFVRALEHAGCRRLAPFANRGRLHALAAAIEYYDGDIEKARAAIERGEYRHCPDVQYYEDLGWDVLSQETQHFREIPQVVLDYIDFESLGRDVEDGEGGKFTHFGYFAPEKQDNL